jgi:glutamate/aspartate transport system substrate-binding protein
VGNVAGLCVIGLALASGGAVAQVERTAPVELTGTLAKARSTGAVTIAYREASVPFSFLSRGQPIGYSIELCRRVVEAMGEAVGRDLDIKWVAVTPETRIEAIVSGRADLECGSTTNNLERQKQVAFSPTIFVAGTKLMVGKGSPIRSSATGEAGTVAVTGGTTNRRRCATWRRSSADFRLLVLRDHAESFAQVVSGKAGSVRDRRRCCCMRADRAKQGAGPVSWSASSASTIPTGSCIRRRDTQLASPSSSRTFRALADDGEMERQ